MHVVVTDHATENHHLIDDDVVQVDIVVAAVDVVAPAEDVAIIDPHHDTAIPVLRAMMMITIAAAAEDDDPPITVIHVITIVAVLEM